MNCHAIRLIMLGLVALLLTAGDACAKPGQPEASSYTLELKPFATHAGTNAMELTHAPDDTGRVFVSTQSGQVYVYDADGSARGVFLDLDKADVEFTFDSKPRQAFKGLMYIAFHPDYAVQSAAGSGCFYTAHEVTPSKAVPDFNTRDFGGLGDSDKRFVVAEWRVDPSNPDRIDPSSYRQLMLLHFHTYASNPHAIGEIAFNPYAKPGEADYGKLYIAVGDGHNGSYDKPHSLARAQTTDNPFAKILRIDPLAKGDQPYTIPEDNPFGTEVYAIGLRDPQWFSFAKDLEGKVALVACDIGALAVEEINVIRPGGNYGWPRYEGTLDFDTDATLNGEARKPVVHYERFFPKTPGGKSTNAGLVAIMGGIVVSDPDDPSFQGEILFGDLPSGTLMHANFHHALTREKIGRQSTPFVLQVRLGEKTGNFADVIGAKRGDIRFGVDQAGSVYLVSKRTDTIFKTKLVYTGLPARTVPSVSQPGVFNQITGILLTVGGIGLLLLIMLAWVVRSNKRKAA